MAFGKRQKRKPKEAPAPKPFIGDINDKLEEDPLLALNIEEIKSMRDEITWRVKIAYNGSIIFLSAISIIVGSLYTKDNNFIDEVNKNPKMLTISGIAILIALSAWVGVQNANHLIEKRIELYTLELMRVAYKRSNHVSFSWLGYLYGSRFFTNPTKQFIGKFLNASIGMFIYLLPNLVAMFVWYYVFTNGVVKDYLWSFIVASFFLLVAMASTLFFFFYVVKVNNNFTDFYKKIMKPYFEKNGIQY